MQGETSAIREIIDFLNRNPQAIPWVVAGATIGGMLYFMDRREKEKLSQQPAGIDTNELFKLMIIAQKMSLADIENLMNTDRSEPDGLSDRVDKLYDAVYEILEYLKKEEKS